MLNGVSAESETLVQCRELVLLLSSDAYLNCVSIILIHCVIGGQVEIQALCSILHRQIWIYSSDINNPIVKMGEDIQRDVIDPPIRVTYHRQYYSLGEHYNSVVNAT